ncbi:MAG: aldose 1-epimerase family protein [Alsobacter sp.]
MSDECVGLQAGRSLAVIALRGAEWRRWHVGGADRLWTADPAWWTDVAPLLFPVVGWTRGGVIRVAGSPYPLGLHGFARTLRFAVDARDQASVRLVAQDDETTRRAYPFAFGLAVTLSLDEWSVSLSAEVTNRSAGPMPYGFGFHPGFCWPFDGSRQHDYAVQFEAAEEPTVPRIAPGGLFSAHRRKVPLSGHTLPLSAGLFAREALCFLDARSHGLRFLRRGGSAIRVAFEGCPALALWSRAGAPFLCVEGWQGYGDPEDFAGDLAEKPGLAHLPPGQTARHAMRVTFEPKPVTLDAHD